MVRTYVVTGSASGMGLAVQEHLEAQGFRVIGVDRHRSEIQVDLSTPGGRARMLRDVEAATGGTIDAVIACAGVSIRPGDPLTVRVNYFGAVATLTGLRPMLARGANPRAVVISSLGCIHPCDDKLVDACLADDERLAVAESDRLVGTGNGQKIYASSKRALSRWVRREAPRRAWAGAGIPLNAIAPGAIDTPLAGLDDPKVAAAMERYVPMPLHGHGKPAEVAPLLAWLASPENVLVTGQLIFIDGGADTVLRGDDIFQSVTPPSA